MARLTPEGKFKEKLRADLESMFPGIFILIGNSQVVTGIPDWILFYNDRWAMLEAKASETASKQPNQPYYVDMFNAMSFAAFVYPENKEHVLHELQLFFTPRSRRAPRVPKR